MLSAWREYCFVDFLIAANNGDPTHRVTANDFHSYAKLNGALRFALITYFACCMQMKPILHCAIYRSGEIPHLAICIASVAYELDLACDQGVLPLSVTLIVIDLQLNSIRMLIQMKN